MPYPSSPDGWNTIQNTTIAPEKPFSQSSILVVTLYYSGSLLPLLFSSGSFPQPFSVARFRGLFLQPSSNLKSAKKFHASLLIRPYMKNCRSTIPVRKSGSYKCIFCTFCLAKA